MPNFRWEDLRRMASDIFYSVGAPKDTADLVADALVQANLSGHDSHGVIRIVEYLNKIKSGNINPKANPELVGETATTVRVDGHWGFGQVVARWTMERLISKASQHLTSAGCAFNCGHAGLIGSYTAMAAEKGMIALGMANGGGTTPRVAPFGGGAALFGTNPISAAIPVANETPIIVDFSTSAVASGKIRVARDKGEQLPAGWIIDREGRPSRDPKDYYDGGMLLAAAGHKGYGMSVLVEMLGGVLSGSGSPALSLGSFHGGNGLFFFVVDVRAFRPFNEFSEDVTKFCRNVRSSPPIQGVRQVLLPGEPERQTRDRRSAEGIDVPKRTWQSIAESARTLSVEIPSPIGE